MSDMRKYGLYCNGMMILVTHAKNEREARKYFREYLGRKTLHGYEVGVTSGWAYDRDIELDIYYAPLNQ